MPYVRIRYSAKGIEHWGTYPDELYLECVGIPPYPGETFPRVIGIVRLSSERPSTSLGLQIVHGSVTEPRGTGRRIIAHIVNHRSATWGAGVARAIANQWPLVQDDFRDWVMQKREEFKLGSVHEFSVTSDLSVVSMVAQYGFGESIKPRIRYSALEQCLVALANLAKRTQASIHMPKIGTGFAGGSWEIIEELILVNLASQGTNVTVYVWPGPLKPNPQAALEPFVSGS